MSTDPNSVKTEDVPTGARRGGSRRDSYGSGEGYAAGNVAPESTWLNLETNKVTKTQPERSKALTIKGDPVEPWAARVLEDKKFKG
jgi:hypothetical protein